MPLDSAGTPDYVPGLHQYARLHPWMVPIHQTTPLSGTGTPDYAPGWRRFTRLHPWRRYTRLRPWMVRYLSVTVQHYEAAPAVIMTVVAAN